MCNALSERSPLPHRSSAPLGSFLPSAHCRLSRAALHSALDLPASSCTGVILLLLLPFYYYAADSLAYAALPHFPFPQTLSL